MVRFGLYRKNLELIYTSIELSNTSDPIQVECFAIYKDVHERSYVKAVLQEFGEV